MVKNNKILTAVLSGLGILILLLFIIQVIISSYWQSVAMYLMLNTFIPVLITGLILTLSFVKIRYKFIIILQFVILGSFFYSSLMMGIPNMEWGSRNDLLIFGFASELLAILIFTLLSIYSLTANKSTTICPKLRKLFSIIIFSVASFFLATSLVLSTIDNYDGIQLTLQLITLVMIITTFVPNILIGEYVGCGCCKKELTSETESK